MRIALLSDIHGNLVALDAVLADVARHGPFDHIVVAGDLVWSGPWPAEVVDRVRAEATAVIQGNTDAYFLRRADEAPRGKNEERFAAQLTWMCDHLGPERVAYLASLPFEQRFSPAPGDDLLVVHANPRDLERPIVPRMPDADLDILLLDGGEPDWAALAFGHVHVPFVREWRGRLLVDVSSVGLPMDGDTRAAYAIFTWDDRGWHAEHHRVFYDAPVAARQMRMSGMPRGKHFAERLMSGSYSPLPYSTVVAAD